MVPSTADAGPPLLVQGTEGGLVVPTAAPVPWLQFLVWGEEQHIADRQGTCRAQPEGLVGQDDMGSKGMVWESGTPQVRS